MFCALGLEVQCDSPQEVRLQQLDTAVRDSNALWAEALSAQLSLEQATCNEQCARLRLQVLASLCLPHVAFSIHVSLSAHVRAACLCSGKCIIFFAGAGHCGPFSEGAINKAVKGTWMPEN